MVQTVPIAPPVAPGSDPAAAPRALPEALAGSFAAGGEYRFLTAADGTRLRYALWRQPAARRKGSVVLLGGRGEFIEKYAGEMIGELLARRLAVYALDWRGQGLSQRPLPDREKGHVEDFAAYRDDLRQFLEQVVAAEAGGPVVALAHSMGAHTVLRYLAEQAGAGIVSRAVLCAPMTGLRHARILRAALLTALPGTARADAYALGSGPFNSFRRVFAENRVTSDAARYAFTEEWFTADPRLRLGGPTYAWLRAGLASIALLRRPGYLAAVRVPVMILSAGRDLLVNSASHQQIARLLPDCRLRCYAESRHEIMMERDPIRARFWSDFDTFALTGDLSSRPAGDLTAGASA